MRVSWGSSRKITVADDSGGDVSIAFDSNQNPSTVESVTFALGSLDELSNDDQIFVDIRTSYKQKRFRVGTVGEITTPPICVNSGTNSLEGLDGDIALIKWKVVICDNDGFIVAQMRELSDFNASRSRIR